MLEKVQGKKNGEKKLGEEHLVLVIDYEIKQISQSERSREFHLLFLKLA